MAEPAGHAVSNSRVDVAPDALGARLSRARALLAPTPDPGLTDALRAARCALDPEYARQLGRELAYRETYGKRKAKDGHASGWKNGTPQCPSCRRILAAKDGWCPSCRAYGGDVGLGR